MKKLLFAIVSMASISGLWAQDFAPSQQAQGYLDSKNATVDHATGLFHYKVPIYTLRSGDFELPISLDYVGKGVRDIDIPGLIGYNWNLNVGGVVTRTVRGGFADETYYSGYINKFPLNNYPPDMELKLVNEREIDGESDIFTAIFCGQTVHFIILRDANRVIYAEPLERTNVKIECEPDSGDIYSIKGWIITDESGNKFYFSQEERSYKMASGVSTANMVAGSYVSSWHISRIEPLNSKPIIYTYKGDVPRNNNSNADINRLFQNSGIHANITYGSPILYKPFNFQKYRASFELALNYYIDRISYQDVLLQQQLINAKSDLQGVDLSHPFNSSPIDYIDNAIKRYELQYLIANTEYTMRANGRMMGILRNMLGVSNASYLLLLELDKLNLEIPAAILRECFMEHDTYSEQKITIPNQGYVNSPLLDNIVCGDEVAKIEYTRHDKEFIDHGIKSITIGNTRDSSFIDVRFNHHPINGSIGSRFLLSQLSFFDRDNVESERIKFDYYNSDMSSCQYDTWGFVKDPDPDVRHTNPEYVKTWLLSKIRTSGEGEINVDYELHEMYSSTLIGRPVPGGIRVKSIVLTDPITNNSDHIKYHYPMPFGIKIYMNEYREEDISYNNYAFRDHISYSRVRNKGNELINTGNYGYYYEYVEEELVGKGRKTYLFFVPKRRVDTMPYKFWLAGLPLTVATYDQNGNLKSLVKNHYWADVDIFDINEYGYESDREDFFSYAENPIRYSKSLPQIKAYDYYSKSSQELEGEYPNIQTEPFFNPYRDHFEPNIKPRTNVDIPEQRWNLIYGGKVLLKSQEEYRIEGNYSTASSIDHFKATNLGTSFNKVEYFYDNIAASTAPTRVVTTDSEGNTYTSLTRRVADMNVSGVLSEMKSKNILSPVVEKQTLRNGKLLDETVNVYTSSTHDGKSYYGVAEEKSYIPSGTTTISTFPATDNNLYTYGSANYTTEKTIGYTYNNSLYAPSSINARGNISAAYYPPEFDLALLAVSGYDDTYISAANSLFRHNNDLPGIFPKFITAYSAMLWIDQINIQTNNPILSILNSPEYLALRRIIGSVAFAGIYPTLQQDIDLIRFNTAFHRVLPRIDVLTRSNSDVNDIITVDSWIVSNVDMFETNPWAPVVGSIKNNSVAARMKLYIISNGYDTPINYTVTYSGGTSTGSITPVSKLHWNVQALDIDLTALNGLTSIEISNNCFYEGIQNGSCNIAYMCLVPSDCEFEATSYNSDGTVFCKFDQTGAMERYEYDGAGRVIRVWDGNGSLLEENTYNINLP